MEWYRHPHLTRGIVHTIRGRFIIHRGLVLVPEELGEHYGWQKVDAGGNQSSPKADAEATRRPALSNH